MMDIHLHNHTTSRWTPLLASLIAAVIMFGIFFWPVYSHVTESIFCGDDNTVPSSRPMPMFPGDQIQLMYHFWLFTDMLTGQTPWFHNLYEFNVGNDAERRELSTYYVPFSFFFAIGYWIKGYALGWNLSAIISIWLTIWLTFLFVRRYTRTNWQAWLCTFFAVALPYRWINIAGGSPTGFSMAWVPLLMIGLDRLIIDRKVSGGWLAGLAIFLSSLSDSHVFFFLVISTPAWMLIAVIYRTVVLKNRPGRADIATFIKGAIGLAALVAVAYLLKHSIKETIEASSAAGGRNISEVLLYAPRAEGILSRTAKGVSEYIYIGYAVFALITTSLLAGMSSILHGPSRAMAWRWLLLQVLAISGFAGIVILALGPRGPWDGWMFVTAREWIPHFTMIRQTAKVFCLLPVLMAIVSALTFRIAEPLTGASKIPTWLIVIILMYGLVESKTRLTPALQYIDQDQKAYEAVAKDAASRKEIPRVLVVTLWPGDAHVASIYQHFSSTYHIRMVNGYFPFVDADYIKNVFQRLESVNMGLISDEQIKWLRDRDIHYIIVHENIYYEKVSAFPIAYALQNFLDDARFELIGRDGPVWAFRLLDRPRQNTVVNRRPAQWPSGRYQEVEQYDGADNITFGDDSALGQQLVRMTGSEHRVVSRTWDYGPANNLQWAIRTRGNGRFLVNRFVENAPVGSVETSVASPNWEWVYVSIPRPETRHDAHFEIQWLSGEFDLDMVQFLAGEPILPKPGDTWSMPAAFLFHAGYSTPEMNHVVFDPHQESPGTFIYGPKLPFPAGKYEIQLEYSSPAPQDKILGCLSTYVPDGRQIYTGDFISETPFVQEINIPDNLPLNMVITMYDHNYPVTIKSVSLKRID